MLTALSESAAGPRKRDISSAQTVRIDNIPTVPLESAAGVKYVILKLRDIN